LVAVVLKAQRPRAQRQAVPVEQQEEPKAVQLVALQAVPRLRPEVQRAQERQRRELRVRERKV
jgi:hypothetical protein